MLQRYLYIFFFFMLFSCNEHKKVNVLSIESNGQNKFNRKGVIDFIKKNVENVKLLNLSMSKIDLDDLKPFTKYSLGKMFDLKGKKIVIPDEFDLNFPESFHFYQGKEYEGFYLMTFIHVDEICCKSLYGATFSKRTDSLISIAKLTHIGADGGWSGNQTVKWSTENTMNFVEFSEYDNDLDSSTINSEIDSVWGVIKLNKKGEFKFSETKTVSYIGNQLKS